MNNKFGKDLTTGSVPKHLIRFALPILIGNILSTGYGIINAIWVGRLLGKEAVGAVAVGFPIFLGMIALASGATTASSILISKAYGAKEHEKIQKVVNNSWSLAIMMILFVTISGVIFSNSLLRLLGTPEEIMGIASGYLKISFFSFAGMYLSFLLSSILRGIGNTVIPLIFIVISTALNAILDPVLIMGLGPMPELGLNGAAYASLIATSVATILGLVYVLRKYSKQPINPSGLLFEKDTIIEIIKIGFPSFMQQMLASVGYGVVTVFVNGFGASAIAAYGIATRLDSIIVMPAIAIMIACSGLTAQNIGAGKPERIKDILKWGIIVNIPVIFILSAMCMSFPTTIMGIFVKDEAVIQIGKEYLMIVGIGYLFSAIFYVSNGIIAGAGKTISTMIITAISLCVIRIPLAGLLSKTSMGIRGIWVAITLSFAITTINSLLYYFFGNWKKGVSAQKAAKISYES